jgi:hypothetical protein
MDILQSASKMVFLMMAIATIGLTAAGVVDAKDFLMLAAMAFSFYFSNKGDTNKPYAGK